MLIVFEGIDGCGKTTQLWKLAKYLFYLNKHNHLLITREPYKNLKIRQILKQDINPKTQKEKLTKLFIKDREDHIKEIIKPLLQKGITLISDRYKYSTIAYQSAQGQDMNKLIEMQKEFPTPDLIFLIDLPVNEAIKRIRKDKRKEEQKFEKNKDFLEKTRQNYLKLKQLLPNENIIIINGSKTIEEIFENIKKHLKNYFKH